VEQRDVPDPPHAPDEAGAQPVGAVGDDEAARQDELALRVLDDLAGPVAEQEAEPRQLGTAGPVRHDRELRVTSAGVASLDGVLHVCSCLPCRRSPSVTDYPVLHGLPHFLCPVLAADRGRRER
jgi:hypothetical protein